MTDLATFIRTSKLVDTHEHLPREIYYTEWRPDVLADLFGSYTNNDLIAAGATAVAAQRVADRNDPDVQSRFAGIKDAWSQCRHTGYGQATRLTARLAYGIEDITEQSLVDAHERHSARNFRGERLRLLRDVARLDHAQIDLFDWETTPDHIDAGFFFYDLSARTFANGELQFEDLERELGASVVDLRGLLLAIEHLFERRGPMAIAVKTQHAYDRTLAWSTRTDTEAATALELIRSGNSSQAARLCIGDWCLDHVVRIASIYKLPIKIHTGYLARNSYMQIHNTRVGLLCPLLARHPEARFVLMHIASGHEHELLAIAKHYPNVYVDLCWAWSINPRTTGRFVCDYLHQVPTNRLFAFGGDTFTPTAAIAYAYQAREGLLRALTSEVKDHTLSESEAISIAGRFMRENQHEAFDLIGRQRLMAFPSEAQSVKDSV